MARVHRYPNTAFVIYGDHGRSFPWLSPTEAAHETLNPFLMFLLPTSTEEHHLAMAGAPSACIHRGMH